MKLSKPVAVRLPVLLLLLMTGTGSPEAANEQEKLKEIQSRIRSVQKNLDSLEGRKSKLVEELAGIERSYGKSADALRKINLDIQDKAQRERAIAGKLQVLNVQLGEQRDALLEQIRTSYALGREEGLKILLNQKDSSRVSRILSYYGYLNRARLERVQSVHGAALQLDELKSDLSAEQLRLGRLEKQQQSELASLDRLRQARSQVLAKLDDELADHGNRLKTLKADEKRLEQLIARLEQALGPFPVEPSPDKPFRQLKGKLAWPVTGSVLKRFGSARESERWDGIVIGASEGMTVRAVSRGRVAYADWLKGYGLLTIVDHGEGYMTLYAFNQSLFKNVGEWVDPGDAIATVGNSGGRDKSGLYFEIRRRGKPVNPVSWLRR